MGSSKKARDTTHAELKAKKRKRDDEVPDLPGDVERYTEMAGKKRKRDADADDLMDHKEHKEWKKEKKRRNREAEETEGGVVEGDIVKEIQKKVKKRREGKKDKLDEGNGEVEVEPKKSKKERKLERRAKEAAKATMSTAMPVVEAKSKDVSGDADTTEEVARAEEEKKSKKNNRNREKKRKGAASTDTSGHDGKAEGQEKKDARFICFIGNLPFTATTSSITAHFAAVKPISVRALTQKDIPSKSKGIAFVEFEGYDHMKTCLKLFHHSLFDDGISPARRINVELTAGGGGNTQGRRAKILEKNQKLNEQRVKRMQEEEKAKLEKTSNAAAIDEGAIHPSRRARVPGA